jgi:hypothetical protein
MTRSDVFLTALLYWHGFFWASHLALCAMTHLRLPVQHLVSRPFWVASIVICSTAAAAWRPA